MFTGLVEGVGRVEAFEADPHCGGRIRISSLPWSEPLSKGESVAVNGVCLTVVAPDRESFVADLSPETLARSNLSLLKPRDEVNLERPLRIGDRLGGHFVLGHVDGMGRISSIEPQGGFWTVEVHWPEELARYAVEKGSIAVDGISLTIACLTPVGFTVAIIPKTWETTNLKTRTVGDPVNLEVDMIAKHVERLLGPGSGESPITPSFLKEHGFF